MSPEVNFCTMSAAYVAGDDTSKERVAKTKFLEHVLLNQGRAGTFASLAVSLPAHDRPETRASPRSSAGLIVMRNLVRST
jgi:hypothetical protein